jgi:hypothetical protein
MRSRVGIVILVRAESANITVYCITFNLRPWSWLGLLSCVVGTTYSEAGVGYSQFKKQNAKKGAGSRDKGEPLEEGAFYVCRQNITAAHVAIHV